MMSKVVNPYGYELYKEESDDFGLINDQCVHLIGLFATLEQGNQGRETFRTVAKCGF